MTKIRMKLKINLVVMVFFIFVTESQENIGTLMEGRMTQATTPRLFFTTLIMTLVNGNLFLKVMVMDIFSILLRGNLYTL